MQIKACVLWHSGLKCDVVFDRGGGGGGATFIVNSGCVAEGGRRGPNLDLEPPIIIATIVLL